MKTPQYLFWRRDLAPGYFYYHILSPQIHHINHNYVDFDTRMGNEMVRHYDVLPTVGLAIIAPVWAKHLNSEPCQLWERNTCNVPIIQYIEVIFPIETHFTSKTRAIIENQSNALLKCRTIFAFTQIINCFDQC